MEGHDIELAPSAVVYLHGEAFAPRQRWPWGGERLPSGVRVSHTALTEAVLLAAILGLERAQRLMLVPAERTEDGIIAGAVLGLDRPTVYLADKAPDAPVVGRLEGALVHALGGQRRACFHVLKAIVPYGHYPWEVVFQCARADAAELGARADVGKAAAAVKAMLEAAQRHRPQLYANLRAEIERLLLATLDRHE